ncbi:MAG: putative enoyl-CoA hydratase [Frankiales bacterium]|jgi:enoyl-CoA hydratase/carnithine racemase|nr:putative enoyl-CoA hydratase [Frankiales bacterium]
MSDRVTISLGDDGVADVRLNRADKMNALDPAMFKGLADAGAQLTTMPGLRAVVLSGEGRAFCAGLDFGSFQAMASGDGPRISADGVEGAGESSIAGMDGRITHLGQQAAWVWTEVPVPVIASVHGACLGGGLQIALGADIRIAAPDAKLSVLESRWGLTPDMTATVTLQGLVKQDVLKELVWTGRMLSGTEAAELGVVTRVAQDPLAAAFALAREIAAKSPHATRGAKRLLAGVGSRTLAEQFALERETIGALIGSPNQVEAVTAFFEKRDPVFAEVD